MKVLNPIDSLCSIVVVWTGLVLATNAETKNIYTSF